jgi:3-oxoacyl-[acyl-carrier protein] reductase
MYPLQRKVALVTGSSRGLGRAYALRLAGCGADVAVHDLNRAMIRQYGEGEDPQEVVAQCRAHGVRSAFYEADLMDAEQARRLVAAVLADFGRLDILVNNAGGDIGVGLVKPSPNDCLAIPDEDLRAMIDRNLLTCMHACRAAAPHMLERKQGKIINVASFAAHIGIADGGSVYAVAKAGVVHWTACLAKQLRPHNVTVNCISPGPTRTARFLATRHVPPTDPASSFLERDGEPEELAKVVEFLASPLSDYVSGQTIIVDGGRSC